MEHLNEREFTEEGLIKFIGTTDMFETKTWIERKCLKIGNGTYNRLLEEAKCYSDEILVNGKGKERKYILKGFREIPTNRITGNSNNKYKLSDAEILLKEIIYCKLIEKEKFIEKYETGLSLTGWANFFEIPDNIFKLVEDDTFNTDVETKMIELMKELFKEGKSNEYFKPLEIVQEFQEAINRTRKDVVQNAFMRLERESLIKMEKCKVKVVSNNTKGRNNYVAITEREYKEIEEVKEDILRFHGISKNEFLKNVNKIKKSKKIKEVQEAIKSTLTAKFNAEYAFESIKITEIINTEPGKSVNFKNIESYFYNHLVNLTVKRQNNKKYRESTFFWKRFYLLSTFTFLEKLKRSIEIDVILLEEQKENYEENFYQYLFDFDTGYYIPKQLKDDNFMGTQSEFSDEVLRRHTERVLNKKTVYSLEEIDINDLFTNGYFNKENENIAQLETLGVVKKTLSKGMQEEFDYLKRMRRNNKKEIKKTIRSELILDEEQLKQQERISEIVRANYLKNGDLLSEQWEAEETRQIKLEAKRKEAKRLKAITSLPCGSTFNVKPIEYMIPLDASMEYEQYTEEEIEQMRVEN